MTWIGMCKLGSSLTQSSFLLVGERIHKRDINLTQI